MLAGWLATVPATLLGGPLDNLLPGVWTTAEQRCEDTVTWMTTTYGSPLMHSRYPQVGDLATGRWKIATSTKDWRAGFWPGMHWILAQKTGDATWRQRAEDWSAALATSVNIDHDIGFITVCSFGKSLSFHDELSDPGGTDRTLARQTLADAAAKLDARFNMPNGSGVAVPTGMTRSWNSPFHDPYPVIIDNLMNLELLFLAYEANGRQAAHRAWFDHALAHARNSVARHMRPDGGTYHVVKHFEDGPSIGGIERKITVQGYAAESTWSRGQAWAVYGFAMAYRYANRDPATDASDLLAAAESAAGYFLDHLPDAFTADTDNHVAGDFVPPCDFDAALGEPAGPWNDADGDYDPATGTGLGDARPPLMSFTQRDSSAAAVAASGLLELAGHTSSATNRTRYLAAAEDILTCLVSFDGADAGTDPDYFCSTGDTAYPGILKNGSEKWPGVGNSLTYGDYYFLEALARYEARRERPWMEQTQRIDRVAAGFVFRFETCDPGPALALRVQWAPDLAANAWTTLAARTGNGPWSGSAAVSTQILPNGRRLVEVSLPATANRGFVRILSRSIGGG